MQERLAAEVNQLQTGVHAGSREPPPDADAEVARLRTVRLRTPRHGFGPTMPVPLSREALATTAKCF